ncbi:MAG TPA: hypothetical protein VJV79_19720 [Polyangiaceae bacterium]|nr:hypothetical protein [Polyangiaceae bacterium]
MTKIVLDTNVVRHLGAGEIDASFLTYLEPSVFSVHLSDAAATELIAALCSERLCWEQWVRARAALRATLSSAEPILLGNQQGLQLVGLPVAQKRSLEELESDKRRLTAAWHLLCDVSSLDELLRVHARVPEGAIGFDRDLVANVVAGEHHDWNVSVDRFRDGVLLTAPHAREALPARGDSLEAIDACLAAARETFDADFDKSAARPSIRMDAFLRVCAMFFLRRLRRKDIYNPVKRANDLFDLDLLKYLSFPAVLCTSDNPLIAAVERVGSWQRPWIVRPGELTETSVRARLIDLAWPEETAAA